MNVGFSVKWVRRCGVALALMFASAGVQAADAPAIVHFPVPLKASPQPASNRKMAELLAALDKEIDPMALPFFAERSLPRLRQQMAAVKAPIDLLKLKITYGQALLNSGSSEDALHEFQDVERLAAE